MKRFFILILSIFILSLNNCKLSNESINVNDFESVFYEEILMEGMDIVTMGGSLEVVVNSQSEYEQLIYDRFEKPLQDYWDANYDTLLKSVKENNPGLTDEEYKDLVREIFYSIYPFKGTENYNHPSIDFSKYTLLGQAAHAYGCSEPNYTILVLKNKIKKQMIYRIHIKINGDCEMAINRNKWILIYKIPSDYKIKFELEYSQK